MKKVLTSMNTKMTKWLIASGDSWTAGTNVRDQYGKAVFWVNGKKNPSKYVNPEFPLWPEVLAKNLGMKYLNVGRGGSGNEFIYNRMIDALVEEDNIGFAVCFWSHFDRVDFAKHTIKLNPMILDSFKDTFPKHLKIKQQEVIDVMYKHDMADGIWNFEKSLRWMLAFQNHCEASNIPYIQAQAFYPTFQEECPRLLLEHPIYDHIKENHFIGWPIYKELGGFSLSDKIGNNLRVNWPIDMHPNQEGHELIANVFYNRYQELYDD